VASHIRFSFNKLRKMGRFYHSSPILLISLQNSRQQPSPVPEKRPLSAYPGTPPIEIQRGSNLPLLPECCNFRKFPETFVQSAPWHPCILGRDSSITQVFNGGPSEVMSPLNWGSKKFFEVMRLGLEVTIQAYSCDNSVAWRFRMGIEELREEIFRLGPEERAKLACASIAIN
jgi:hypothetical protein